MIEHVADLVFGATLPLEDTMLFSPLRIHSISDCFHEGALKRMRTYGCHTAITVPWKDCTVNKSLGLWFCQKMGDRYGI